MNKKLYIIITVISLLAYSCIKDDSTAYINPVPEMSIEPFKENYEQLQYSTLIIEPTVEVNTDIKLEYTWFYYSSTTGGTENIKADTISNEKDLNWVINIAPGTYNVQLTVRDVDRDIRTSYKTNLSVITENSEAWYVLKENSDGSSDIDLFAEHVHGVDIIKAQRGYGLEGIPANLGFCQNLNLINPDSNKIEGHPVVIAATDKDISFLDLYTTELRRDKKEAFLGMPGELDIKSIFIDGYEMPMMGLKPAIYMVNKGQLYGVTLGMFAAMSLNKFGLPATFANPYSLSGHFFTSKVYGNPVFYDEISSSFMTVSNGDGNLMYLPENGAATPNKNLNSKMIFMDCYEPIGTTGPRRSIIGYAFLEDNETKGLNVYHYEKTPDPRWNPFTKITTPTTGVDEIKNATLYELNKDLSILYICHDNKVKMFDIMNETLNTMSLGIPSDEEVTMINHEKVHMAVTAPEPGKDYLTVATYKSGSYKVYLFTLDASGNVWGEPEILEGHGKVGDVTRVSAKYYDIFYSYQ